TIELHARGDDEVLDVAANGGLVPAGTKSGEAAGMRGLSTLAWTGTVTQLTAEARDAGRWELAGPTAVTFGAEQARVQGMCWVSGGGRLCADLDWRSAASGQGEALNVQATATELPLKLFTRLLPPDMQVAGTVSGDAHLRTAGGSAATRGVLLGEATLRPSPGTALWTASRGDEVKLQLDGGEVHLVADAGGVAVRGNLVLAQGGTVQGSVSLPGFRVGRPAAEQPLVGHVTAELGNLAFLQALVPQLGATGGTATADLALSGTLATPGVAGNVHLAGARTSVPALGLELTDIDV